MADFKGLELNTDLINFEFNKEVSQNQFGTSSFRLDNDMENDFSNIFTDDDLSTINEIKIANQIPEIPELDGQEIII
jgi:hypothetical protein